MDNLMAMGDYNVYRHNPTNEFWNFFLKSAQLQPYWTISLQRIVHALLSIPLTSAEAERRYSINYIYCFYKVLFQQHIRFKLYSRQQSKT